MSKQSETTETYAATRVVARASAVILGTLLLALAGCVAEVDDGPDGVVVPPADVDVHENDAPDVNIENRDAPDVNVETPDVEIENREAPDVDVDVDVPSTPDVEENENAPDAEVETKDAPPADDNP